MSGVGQSVVLHVSKMMELKLEEGMVGEGRHRGTERHRNTVDLRREKRQRRRV